jgi:2,4-dienoyl-CoA reductase-like NADH-dependent reductase (Old Yellow Enzyme family)
VSALVIAEGIVVDPNGRALPLEPGIWDDSFIPGFRDLADEIHTDGTKIAVQLFYVGRETNSRFFGRPITVAAPSPIPSPLNRGIPKELSLTCVSCYKS